MSSENTFFPLLRSQLATTTTTLLLSSSRAAEQQNFSQETSYSLSDLFVIPTFEINTFCLPSNFRLQYYVEEQQRAKMGQKKSTAATASSE